MLNLRSSSRNEAKRILSSDNVRKRFNMPSFDYDRHFHAALENLRDEGRYRVFADLQRERRSGVHALDHRAGRRITIWCSNDCLSMGTHPEALAAAHAALDASGVGAGGTRNISGTSHEHVLLERELAELHEKPSALLFTSGFVANDAALSTLLSKRAESLKKRLFDAGIPTLCSPSHIIPVMVGDPELAKVDNERSFVRRTIEILWATSVRHLSCSEKGL